MNDTQHYSDVDFTWKIIIAGHGGVGKSTFLHKYLTNEFLEDTKMTIGCSHHSQYVERGDQVINLVFWDLGGQKRFDCLHPAYIRGANLSLLLFDMNSRDTFDGIGKWIKMLRNFNDDSIPIMLVGAKADLVSPDAQNTLIHEMNQLTREKSLVASIVTSSKMDWNIKETVDYTVDYLLWLNSS